MQPSSSTSALTSRLIPENKINPNLYNSSSTSTLRPKILNSKSTSQLHPPGEFGASKVDKLRLETSNLSLNNKTLSNSQSAHILSPNAELRAGLAHSKYYHNNTLSRPFSESANETKMSGNLGGSTAERLEITQAPKANTFIGSLNLSAQQLHDLFKVAHTFFYLRCRERGHSGQDIGSVYDLEMVNLDLVDKNYYFTLSKEGVTQFRNKVSSFTSLSQWEREFCLFHKIAQIDFFRVYKRWKVRLYFYLTLMTEYLTLFLDPVNVDFHCVAKRSEI